MITSPYKLDNVLLLDSVDITYLCCCSHSWHFLSCAIIDFNLPPKLSKKLHEVARCQIISWLLAEWMNPLGNYPSHKPPGRILQSLVEPGSSADLRPWDDGWQAIAHCAAPHPTWHTRGNMFSAKCTGLAGQSHEPESSSALITLWPWQVLQLSSQFARWHHWEGGEVCPSPTHSATLTAVILRGCQPDPILRTALDNSRKAEKMVWGQTSVRPTSAAAFESFLTRAEVRATPLSEMARWKRFLARGDNTWKDRVEKGSLCSRGGWSSRAIPVHNPILDCSHGDHGPSICEKTSAGGRQEQSEGQNRWCGAHWL